MEDGWKRGNENKEQRENEASEWQISTRTVDLEFKQQNNVYTVVVDSVICKNKR